MPSGASSADDASVASAAGHGSEPPSRAASSAAASGGAAAAIVDVRRAVAGLGGAGGAGSRPGAPEPGGAPAVLNPWLAAAGGGSPRGLTRAPSAVEVAAAVGAAQQQQQAQRQLSAPAPLRQLSAPPPLRPMLLVTQVRRSLPGPAASLRLLPPRPPISYSILLVETVCTGFLRQAHEAGSAGRAGARGERRKRRDALGAAGREPARRRAAAAALLLGAISPTRGKGAKAAAGDSLWLTFADAALEARFARWQAASLARVDCWAVLVALLHLAFLGTPPPALCPLHRAPVRLADAQCVASTVLRVPHLDEDMGFATACLDVSLFSDSPRPIAEPASATVRPRKATGSALRRRARTPRRAPWSEPGFSCAGVGF